MELRVLSRFSELQQWLTKGITKTDSEPEEIVLYAEGGRDPGKCETSKKKKPRVHQNFRAEYTDTFPKGKGYARCSLCQCTDGRDTDLKKVYFPYYMLGR
jgi:hypothetical protein